jgi:hypothetical protein
MASAKKDDMWTQFYPMLDEIAERFQQVGTMRAVGG